MTTRSPVLFIVFNRFDTAARVLEAIRKARPPRLYIAADGPRQNRPGEAERCAQVRSLAQQVDWPCEVHTLFRDENLGCKFGPKTAIDWFFQHEPEGIILEDDCVPKPSFFTFCDEMLERYRNDPRVMSVAGYNFHSRQWMPRASYYFSRYNITWGWASWRRAWQHYDLEMRDWPAFRRSSRMQRLFPREWYGRRCWRDIMDRTYDGRLPSAWDYQFIFTAWRLGAYGCVPEVNLVENIGFGPEATHTVHPDDWVTRLRAEEIKFPLRHPASVEIDHEGDRRYELKLRGGGFWAAVERKLRRVLRLPDAVHPVVAATAELANTPRVTGSSPT